MFLNTALQGCIGVYLLDLGRVFDFSTFVYSTTFSKMLKCPLRRTISPLVNAITPEQNCCVFELPIPQTDSIRICPCCEGSFFMFSSCNVQFFMIDLIIGF